MNEFVCSIFTGRKKSK